MVTETVSKLGRLDVLINNHGASIASSSLDLSPGGWRAVIGINLDGVFFCSKAAARYFIEHKVPGTIVNISSTAGVHGSAHMLPYGAGKAGVMNLANSPARAWGQYGIPVNCIPPRPAGSSGPAPRGWPTS